MQKSEKNKGDEDQITENMNKFNLKNNNQDPGSIQNDNNSICKK